MTAYQKAKKRADEVLEKARDEYDKLNDEIEGYEIKKRKAGEAMKAASDACDIKAYNKARREKEDAEAAITMFEAKREKLEAAPLIEKPEYEALTAGIISEVENYINDLREELYNISVNLEGKYIDATNAINDANNLLKCLQFDVNRGYDLQYYTGMKSPTAASILKTGSRDQWAIVAWAGKLNTSSTYQDMKKERAAND